MSDLQQILQAIAALEAQRAVLGDAVVDASLSALRKQLAGLQASERVEQRKLISTLFADLVGFTSMSDKMDPEDVRLVQQAYFKAVTAPIREHGGVIEKYIGDAIMAVFGLPRAEESDADHAVLAGLEMHTALAQLNTRLENDLGLHLVRPLQMRIGVNTGLAVVSSSPSGEFDVVGDSINLASRLQSAAPTSGVLISQDTYRHVRGAFDLQALDPIMVKGKPDPIQVYWVTAPKERSFRTRKRGVEGIETRMVGREAELQTLQAAYLSAVEDHERGAVTIVADPGMGKSRLIYEFENWVDLRPEREVVMRGRARLETQHLPYGLLRDMFAFRFGIQDDDPLPEVWRKFEVGFGELNEEQAGIIPVSPKVDPQGMDLAMQAAFDSQANLQMRAHFVGQMLGYDFSASPYLQAARDDPLQVQQRASAYLESYLTSITASRPLLILLEDLHWADDSSLDLISRLAPGLAGKPVMILATTRSVLYERRQHWMEGQDFHQRLDLRPLSKRDSRRLVEDVLQKVRDIPETLRELVVANAEGNPFYVEELIKMLIEEEVIVKGEEHWQVVSQRLTEIRIPPTLIGVLQARLESLPTDERILMQQASVVGRVFWNSALLFMNIAETRRLDGEAIQGGLTDLRGKEMVYRRDNSAFAGAEELIFKHAMLREVTYASVLKRTRRIYHRSTAEWLAEVTQAGGRLDEYTGLIAEHYSLAEEPLTAADWLTRAGERALLQGALQEAADFFDRALELLPSTEGDRRWRAMEGRGAVLIIRSDSETLNPHLDELMELAQALNNDSYLAEAYLRKAMVLGGHGEDRQALQAYQAALAPARRAGNRLIEARVQASMSIAHVHLGERVAAQAAAEAAMAAALQTGDPKILAKVNNNAAVTFIELGDLARAALYLNSSIEYFRQVGDIPGTGNALMNLGYEYILLGKIEQAISTLEQSREISRGIGARREVAYSGLNLGLARLRAQDAPAALSLLNESIAVLAGLGDEFGQAAGLTYRGLAHEVGGNLEDAAADFRQAMETHTRIGILAYAIDARTGLMRCALAGGRLSEAGEHASLVWQYLDQQRAAGMEFPIWAYLSCAQVFRALEKTREFNAVILAGYQIMMERADKISDPEWRRSFLENVPERRQLLALWTAVDQGK